MAGRTFRFQSLRSPRHKVLLRPRFESIEANVNYSPPLGLSLEPLAPSPPPHIQLARCVERTNQIHSGADGCRFRKP
jgi:hypothetical protein